jgi:hypothetical protein
MTEQYFNQSSTTQPTDHYSSFPPLSSDFVLALFSETRPHGQGYHTGLTPPAIRTRGT